MLKYNLDGPSVVEIMFLKKLLEGAYDRGAYVRVPSWVQNLFNNIISGNMLWRAKLTNNNKKTSWHKKLRELRVMTAKFPYNDFFVKSSPTPILL